MSIGAILAMVINDLKDLRRNLTILPILFIPPLLALIMKKVTPGTEGLADTMPMWLVYGQVLVGMNIISLGISEEKEKKTLEALLVSPVSLSDVISAKLIFAILITLAVQALTVGVCGGLPGNPIFLGAIILVGTAFFALMGLIVGIISPNQKAAGAISTPIMLLFLIGPMAETAPLLRKLVGYLPSYNLLSLFHGTMVNEAVLSTHVRDTWSILVWTLAAAFGSWWVLRRQGTK